MLQKIEHSKCKWLKRNSKINKNKTEVTTNHIDIKIKIANALKIGVPLVNLKIAKIKHQKKNFPVKMNLLLTSHRCRKLIICKMIK